MLNSIINFLNRIKGKDAQKEGENGPGKENCQSSGKNCQARPLPETWIGIDLDGTLAYHDSRTLYSRVGRPVPEMMALVKKMINHGIRIKIFTARAQDSKQLPIIRKWMAANGLPDLEITNVKDFNMIRLYDDRCIQVEKNTGRLITGR